MTKKTGTFSLTRKYVRILGRTHTGHVEFSFAIGEPDLMVELILPEAAFKEFCDANHVIFLTDNPNLPEADQDWAWSLRDATQQRFK